MALLVNKTRQLEILSKVEIADTFVTRLKGLLGRESLEPGNGLLIEPCNSIHCFFMKFPIDVAFVSKDNQVIRIFRDMKPFSASPIIKNARYVVEANTGAFDNNLEPGDYIEVL